jgi:phospholipase D1/2
VGPLHGSVDGRDRSPPAAPASDGPRAAAAAAPGPVFVPGRNCWRVERARRFRCIQDGAEYFRRVREALLAARSSVFILGWDIAAGVDLLPEGAGDEAPTRLAELLDFVVRRRRNLHCHVLIWDYAALYALERDPLSRLKLGWRTHRRVHFRFDDQFPLTSSHHQKVVVVDDRLAFSGGLDLTGHRWDTPEHLETNPLRLNQIGKPYPPFHDVQAMVDGPVAAALGELARERLRRCGVRALPPLEVADEGPWPADLEPDVTDVDVAISRTEPSFHGRTQVREVERLFFESIAAARRSIYLENQYFTNARIADALAARLREPDGPEIVVVGPEQCEGWLEQRTMGALRGQVLGALAAADSHGRLRLLKPMTSRERGVSTFIHSKVMTTDDDLLRIGSANLSNRSMGMDTECDLSIAANGEPRVREGIARVRAKLLAEHLGAPREAVEREIAATGSLIAAIDRLSGGDRTLERIDVAHLPAPETWSTVLDAADPEEPVRVTRALERLMPEIESGGARSPIVWLLPASAVLAAAIAAWNAIEAPRLGTLAAPRELIAAVDAAPGMTWLALGAVVAGSLAFVRLELIALAAIVLLGPFEGGAVALAGAMLSAAIGYGIGRLLQARRVAPWIGRRAYRLWSRLRGRGGASVAILRLVSISSAASIHLLSGVARVPFGEYAVGTLLGTTPWIVVLAVIGGLVRSTVLHPGPWISFSMAALAIGLGCLAMRMHRTFLMRQVRPAMRDQEERARFG